MKKTSIVFNKVKTIGGLATFNPATPLENIAITDGVSRNILVGNVPRQMLILPRAPEVSYGSHFVLTVSGEQVAAIINAKQTFNDSSFFSTTKDITTEEEYEFKSSKEEIDEIEKIAGKPIDEIKNTNLLKSLTTSSDIVGKYNTIPSRSPTSQTEKKITLLAEDGHILLTRLGYVPFIFRL